VPHSEQEMLICTVHLILPVFTYVHVVLSFVCVCVSRDCLVLLEFLILFVSDFPSKVDCGILLFHLVYSLARIERMRYFV